jgi:hypothetical protein
MSDVILIDRIILDAIDLIRKNKWGQAAEIGAPNVYCLATALTEACDSGHQCLEVGDFVVAALLRMNFKSTREAFQWNDTPGRTVNEVIARLESGVRADITEA